MCLPSAAPPASCPLQKGDCPRRASVVTHVSLLPLGALLRVSKRLASTTDAASAFYSSQLKQKKRKTRGNHMAESDFKTLSFTFLFFPPITHLPSHWGLQLELAGGKALVLAKREESVRENKMEAQ